MLVGERRNGNLLVQLGPKLQAQPEELLRQRRSPDGHTEYLIRWAVQNLEEDAGSSSAVSQAENKMAPILMWMSSEEVYANCPTLLGKRKSEGSGVPEEKASRTPEEGALQEMREDVRRLVQRASRHMSQSSGPDSSVLDTIHVLSSYASIGNLAGVFKETGALDLLMKMLCSQEKQVCEKAGKMLRALASHDAGSRAHVLLSLSQQDGIEQHMDFESRYTLLQLFAETTSSEEHCISFDGIHLPQIPGKQLFSLVKRYLCVTSLLDQLSSDQPDYVEKSRLRRHFDFSMAMGSLICELVRAMGWVREPHCRIRKKKDTRSIFCNQGSYNRVSAHVKTRSRLNSRSNFFCHSSYKKHMQQVLRPGMNVRSTEDYELVSAGDEGEYRQSNEGTPPVQVYWYSLGHTYWVHWHMLEIMDNNTERRRRGENSYDLKMNPTTKPAIQSLHRKPLGGLYTLPYLTKSTCEEPGTLRQDEWWEILFFIRRLEPDEQKKVQEIIRQSQEDEQHQYMSTVQLHQSNTATHCEELSPESVFPTTTTTTVQLHQSNTATHCEELSPESVFPTTTTTVQLHQSSTATHCEELSPESVFPTTTTTVQLHQSNTATHCEELSPESVFPTTTTTVQLHQSNTATHCEELSPEYVFPTTTTTVQLHQSNTATHCEELSPESVFPTTTTTVQLHQSSTATQCEELSPEYVFPTTTTTVHLHQSNTSTHCEELSPEYVFLTTTTTVQLHQSNTATHCEELSPESVFPTTTTTVQLHQSSTATHCEELSPEYVFPTTTTTVHLHQSNTSTHCEELSPEYVFLTTTTTVQLHQSNTATHCEELSPEYVFLTTTTTVQLHQSNTATHCEELSPEYVFPTTTTVHLHQSSTATHCEEVSPEHVFPPTTTTVQLHQSNTATHCEELSPKYVFLTTTTTVHLHQSNTSTHCEELSPEYVFLTTTTTVQLHQSNTSTHCEELSPEYVFPTTTTTVQLHQSNTATHCEELSPEYVFPTTTTTVHLHQSSTATHCEEVSPEHVFPTTTTTVQLHQSNTATHCEEVSPEYVFLTTTTTTVQLHQSNTATHCEEVSPEFVFPTTTTTVQLHQSNTATLCEEVSPEYVFPTTTTTVQLHQSNTATHCEEVSPEYVFPTTTTSVQLHQSNTATLCEEVFPTTTVHLHQSSTATHCEEVSPEHVFPPTTTTVQLHQSNTATHCEELSPKYVFLTTTTTVHLHQSNTSTHCEELSPEYVFLTTTTTVQLHQSNTSTHCEELSPEYVFPTTTTTVQLHQSNTATHCEELSPEYVFPTTTTTVHLHQSSTATHCEEVSPEHVFPTTTTTVQLHQSNTATHCEEVSPEYVFLTTTTTTVQLHQSNTATHCEEVSPEFVFPTTTTTVQLHQSNTATLCEEVSPEYVFPTTTTTVQLHQSNTATHCEEVSPEYVFPTTTTSVQLHQSNTATLCEEVFPTTTVQLHQSNTATHCEEVSPEYVFITTTTVQLLDPRAVAALTFNSVKADSSLLIDWDEQALKHMFVTVPLAQKILQFLSENFSGCALKDLQSSHVYAKYFLHFGAMEPQSLHSHPSIQSSSFLGVLQCKKPDPQEAFGTDRAGPLICAEISDLQLLHNLLTEEGLEPTDLGEVEEEKGPNCNQDDKTIRSLENCRAMVDYVRQPGWEEKCKTGSLRLFQDETLQHRSRHLQPRENMVKMLVELLTNQVKEKLLVVTCLQLTYVVMSKYDWRVLFATEGGVRAVLGCMQEHQSSAAVQHAGLAVLKVLTGVGNCELRGSPRRYTLSPSDAQVIKEIFSSIGSAVSESSASLLRTIPGAISKMMDKPGCFSSVHNGLLVVRMLMENHKSLAEYFSTCDLPAVLERFSEVPRSSESIKLHAVLTLLVQCCLSEMKNRGLQGAQFKGAEGAQTLVLQDMDLPTLLCSLKDNQMCRELLPALERCICDGVSSLFCDVSQLLTDTSFFLQLLSSLEPHRMEKHLQLSIYRILNKSLDYYQEDVLPWHLSIEPCLTSLGRSTTDQEVLQEVVSFLHRLASTSKDCAVVMCRLGTKDTLRKVLEKQSSALLQAHELKDQLSNCEKYSSLYQKLGTNILAGCIQMVLGQIEESRLHHQPINIPFFGLFLRSICQGSSREGNDHKCWEKIEVSSNPHRACKLTDGNPNSYWESSGSSGSHYINIYMHRGVVIRQLAILVAGEDSSYMPARLVVMGGENPSSINTELNAVNISSTARHVLILENATRFWPVIQIKIKRCQQGGIDTRVRGLEILGPKPTFWPVFKEQLCRRTFLFYTSRAHTWGQEICEKRENLLHLFNRLNRALSHEQEFADCFLPDDDVAQVLGQTCWEALIAPLVQIITTPGPDGQSPLHWLLTQYLENMQESTCPKYSSSVFNAEVRRLTYLLVHVDTSIPDIEETLSCPSVRTPASSCVPLMGPGAGSMAGIALCWQGVVQQQVVRFLEVSWNDLDVVPRFCSLYLGLRQAMDELFGQQTLFLLSLRQGFCEGFLQLSFLTALHVTEQFARYIDQRIQEIRCSASDLLPMNQLQQFLEFVLFLSDLELANSFEHFYRHYLADRLLSLSPCWLESSVVDYIGLCFPNRLPQEMLKNLQEAKDLQREQHLYRLQELDTELLSEEEGEVIEEELQSFDENKDLEVHTAVLSPRSWPVSSLCYMDDPRKYFPESLTGSLKCVTDFYMNSQSVLGSNLSRCHRLQWTWLGNAELQYGDLTLHVSTLQMFILLLFNHQKEVSKDDIAQCTGVPESLINQALAPLTTEKGILLLGEKRGHLYLNVRALKGRKTREVLSLLPRQTYVNVEEDEGCTLEKKMNIIFSLITQIMKEEKELHIDKLVFRVIDSYQKQNPESSLKFQSWTCRATDVLSCIMHQLRHNIIWQSKDRPYMLHYEPEAPPPPLLSAALSPTKEVIPVPQQVSEICIVSRPTSNIAPLQENRPTFSTFRCVEMV
ncbi:cullin-9-like [Rhinophrynus dorsalis]